MDYWTRVLAEVRNRHNPEFKKCFVHFPELINLDKFSSVNKSKKPERYHYDRHNPKRYYLDENFPGVYLTDREFQCAQWMLQRLNYAGVALKMGLSVRTVECYFTSIRIKLCCESREETIRVLALQAHWCATTSN